MAGSGVGAAEGDAEILGAPWLSLAERQPAPLPVFDELLLADGTLVTEHVPAQALPVGWHIARTAGGDPVAHLAVRPELRLPQGLCAFMVFVNNLRTSGSWGVGDLADVAHVADLVAGEGVDLVALGPTSAISMWGPVAASPYSPSSRLFKSVLHLRPELVPGCSELVDELRDAHVLADRLNQLDLLDLTAARDTKLLVLRRLFDRALASGALRAPAFRRFQRDLYPELGLYALFCAAHEVFGGDWRSWPLELRHPSRAVRSRFSGEHERDRLFVEWCQWQLDEQMERAAGRGCGLVVDLPVATPPDSADAWMWQDGFEGCEQLGAPADYFNPHGHAWGLVPLHPKALVDLEFRPFIAAVRNNLRHAAALRLDHAYGLFQQYWRPAGGGAGRFVSQPSRQLLDLLAIEAGRAGAFVVTEELGTEPSGAEERFREYGFLSLRPFVSDQFDPERAAGFLSVTCHDLPPLGTCLSSGAQPVTDHVFLDRARSRVHALLNGAAADEPLPVAVYRALSALSPNVLAFSADDVFLTKAPFNLPGVSDELWPNFLKRAPLLADLARHPSFAGTAAACAGGLR